jgi:lipoyl(octanoyl) transferase
MDTIRIIHLGLVDYASAWELQQAAAAETAGGGREALFLLEHPPTITFGRNGGAEHLPFSPAFFAERGISLAQADRGGSITCHFPGQMVAYPVMRLERRPGGLRRFFHDLEESVIRTLARFSLSAGREHGRPGVWVQGRKICSTGIAVKRWISTHGLSLNLSADLALFDLVSPCGLAGVQATSIHRERGNADITMPLLKDVFVQEFCALFGLTS